MNIPKLLSLLNEYKVKYVIIGASAMPIHGYSRHTHDIDIFIEATPENAKKTIGALKRFGYDLSDLTEEEILNKKILLRQYIVETDIHPFVTGTTWEKVWKSKVTDKFEGVPTYFASLDELIKMKKAAGRGRDLDDLQYLLKIKQTKKRKVKK